MSDLEPISSYRFNIDRYNVEEPVWKGGMELEVGEDFLERYGMVPPLIWLEVERLWVMGMAVGAGQILGKLRGRFPGDSALVGMDVELVSYHLYRNRERLERERDANMAQMREGLLREQLEVCGHPVKQLYGRVAQNLGMVLDQHAQDVVDGKKGYTANEMVQLVRWLDGLQKADPCLRKGGEVPVEGALKNKKLEYGEGGRLEPIMKRILEMQLGGEEEARAAMDRLCERGEAILRRDEKEAG